MTGSLHVVAAHDGERTSIVRLRQDGLARSSRPLRDPAERDAVRLVVSHLGPGFVRGDRFETTVDLGPRAHVVLAAQSATRVLGAGDASTMNLRVRLAANARLYLAGEPTIAYAGAAHRSDVDVELGDGAAFASVDAFAPHEPFRHIASRVRVSIGGRLAVHDALALVPSRLTGAVGTAFYVRAGIAAHDTARLAEIADDAARRARSDGMLRIGIGSPAVGGVAIRATGRHVRDVRDALAAIVALLRANDRDVIVTSCRRTSEATFAAGLQSGR